jgi:hypothetical protein
MSYKSITDFIKPTIITAQQYGTKVSVEIDHSDTDIDELFDAFQTLVVGLGYHESAWKKWILDRADEYRETDAEELKEKLTEWQNDEVADLVFHNDVKFTDEEIDKALAQHNAHEEGFEIDESDYDDYGQLIEPNEALKLAAKKYKKVIKKTKNK